MQPSIGYATASYSPLWWRLCIVAVATVTIQVLLGTGGMAAALSTVAVCAPSDQFLAIGGPLAMLTVVIFGAGLSTYFLPASAAAINLSASSLWHYGGTILVSHREFSGLCDSLSNTSCSAVCLLVSV